VTNKKKYFQQKSEQYVLDFGEKVKIKSLVI